jgi:hypothetical protein
VGAAQRLRNGNTLVWFGADTGPATLQQKNRQIFTLVEADTSPKASALAVLDVEIAGSVAIYRALPLDNLFGEVAGREP